MTTCDQAVPFQRSNSGGRDVAVAVPPAAKQLVVLAHDTATSEPPCASFGLRLIDQCEPSHRSMTGPPTPSPTAKQLAAVAQDTPASRLAPPCAAAGLGTIVQVVPFHFSVSPLFGP